MQYFLSSVLALLIVSGSTPTSIYAASFTLNSSPVSTQGSLTLGQEVSPASKQLVVTGYGVSEEQALKMAFRAAVEQYVGVVVDSSTIVKNSTLIEDSLLTASNGFIQTYEKISTSTQDGLVMVKILATVKSQRLVESIHKLNIATMQISGGKNIAARIETKQIAKEDALKILNKAWDEAWSDQARLDMLKINIDNVKVQEDKAKDGKVPVTVHYSISVDMAMYKAKVANLETIFKQLGAKQLKRYDMPKKSGRIFVVSNQEAMRNIPKSSIAFLKLYGQGYVVDLWKFPSDWGVHKCFDDSLFGKTERNHTVVKHQLYTEIKSLDGSILYADSIVPEGEVSFFEVHITFWGYRYMADGCQKNYGNNMAVSPIFFGHTKKNSLDANKEIKGSFTALLDIQAIKNIKDVSLIIEPR